MIDVIYLHQFVVRITISKNLNVDSRLVSYGAPTYSPNRVLSYRCWIGSKLGFPQFLYIPNLVKLNRCFISTKISVLTPSSASIIHSLCTNVYSMSDVMKYAFLMMMCPQFCLPVGFFRVQQGRHCCLVHEV
jgi:hypothetical protein